MSQIPIQDLIFLDESGANLHMSPRYSRGYKKGRVSYAVPFNTGNHLTLISAISVRKVEAAL